VTAYLDRNIDKAFAFNELIIFPSGGIHIFVPKVSCFTNFVDFVGKNDCQTSVFSPFHQIF
jgi:hypothetical protein